MQLRLNNSMLPRLSVLMLGPQDYFEKLKNPLQRQAEEKFKIPLEINRAELLKDVIEKTNYSLFDCVIMLVDVSKDNFAAELTAALSVITTPYLSTRLMLVNGCSGSCPFFAAVEFKRVADRFGINYISAEIIDHESCECLVERLILLIELTTGVTSGNPIPVPTATVISNLELNSSQYNNESTEE